MTVSLNDKLEASGVNSSESTKRDIAQLSRSTIRSYLSKCGIICEPLAAKSDLEFYNDCCEEAIRRGYPMDVKSQQSVRPFIQSGVAIATTAYGHLRDRKMQILIALFTACVVYLDDISSREMGPVYLFNERFLRGKEQGDKVLDALAELSLELSSCYNRVAANIIITSTLNGVTAIILEHETQGMAMSNHAHNYPTFCRMMSGYSEAYALWVFPPEIPMDAYIQAFPDLARFIDNTNDVLSFYKEELNGESVNRISLLAACRSCPKREALRQVAQAAVETDNNIAGILEPNASAYEAYQEFRRGFVGFHTTLNRYKLDDLDLI